MYRELTVQEAEAVLLVGLDLADGEPSKVNPSFTRRQLYDIFFGAVLAMKKSRDTTLPTRSMSRNIQREFGKIELPSCQEMLAVLQKKQEKGG